MMKIIVTGGAGFIGSHLTKDLVEKDYEVIVIDNLSMGKRSRVSKKAKFYEIDICSDEISEIFKKEKPDYLLHLAAIPRVPISVKTPAKTTKVNVFGTANLLQASVNSGIKRVVFASSSSVYGDQEKFPLKESMTPSPISPYGLQKLQGEQLAQLFSDDIYNLPVVSLRYFNVYGPELDFESDYSLVLGKFLRLSKKEKPLTIYGDGEQTRAFCYVKDVTEATIEAMNTDKLKGGEIINIGGDESHSINYLADLIGGDRKYLPPRKGDVKHTAADITKAEKLLDWSPKVSFEEGIKKTKDWFYSL